MTPFKPKSINGLSGGNSIDILSSDFKIVDLMRSLNMNSSPLKADKSKEHQKENIASVWAILKVREWGNSSQTFSLHYINEGLSYNKLI